MHPLFLAFLFLFLTAPPAQKDEPKPVISKDPLTAEQIAIYRAVLQDYTQGEDAALNIADVTAPFSNDLTGDGSCQEGISAPDKGPLVVHRMDPAVALNPKMVLVDPNRQNKTVKKNDPGNAIHSAVADGRPVSDKEVEKSVKQAFATGLFTFSEIIFDKDHTYAAVWYSFHCGSLCGRGNTIVLKKVEGKWKISKHCGGWIS
jgi:hypothetical protein